MHRLVLLWALLTPITTLSNTTANKPQTSESRTYMTAVVTNSPATANPKQTMTKPRSDSANSPMLNYIFDSYATSNKHFHDMFKAPSFEDSESFEESSIDADTGATVFLHCQVSSLRDKTISWLKVADDEHLQLLTLDLKTHTADYRFHVDLAGETWRLSISKVKVTDSGVYGCHISTHPPMLKRFQLTVHQPEITLTKEAFLETSETLALKCMILHLHSEEVTPIIRWYKGDSSVPIDEIRGGVLIETDLRILTSNLQVAELKVEDAGNYTCALETPLKMRAVSKVHVLQGSNLAELQSGVRTTTSYLNLLLAAIIVVLGFYKDIR